MKRLFPAIIAISMLVFGAESGNDLFQKALVTERTEGNLAGAVKLYQRIADEFASDRKLVVRALLQMGLCYEKLGKDEAQKAYERIVREFADQPEAATEARARLAVLAKSGNGESRGGISVRRVAPGVGTYGNGISPDGRYLTYTDAQTGNLGVRDLRNGTTRLLTRNEPWDEFAETSVFAPGGKQIVYEWYSKNSSYDLRIIGLDGSGDRLLLRGEKGDYFRPLDWSSDGTRILAALYKDWPAGGLALVSVADGKVQAIKSRSWRSGPGNSTAGASLSPDGRYVVYDQAATEGANQGDIFLLAVDGSRDSVLVQDPADERNPVWTPDGTHVLFASNRTGSMGFWAIEVADGKPQGVPNLVKADVNQWRGMVGFTDDGSLYYSQFSGMEDIYIAELDPATGEVVGQPRRASTGFVGANMGPVWSPDGQYLAYDSQRGRDRFMPGSLVTVIHNMQTGEEREIKTGFIKSGPTRWFPDGQSLLYPVYRDRDVASQAVDYYRLDVRTGEATLLHQSAGGLGSNYPTLSPDGKTIYHPHRDDDGSGGSRSSLMAYEIDSRREREVYRAGAGRRVQTAAVSPDSRELAFVEVEGNIKKGTVARIIPAAGGEARELMRSKPPGFLSYFVGGIAWSPDGQYLFMSECDRDSTATVSCELLRISAKGGEPQRLGITMEGPNPMCVHPDGRQIAFGSGQTKWASSEIWVMENFLPLLKN